MDLLCFLCLVFAMPLCASVCMCLVVFNCEFVTLGHVWYLIVSIPDLCTLSCFQNNCIRKCLFID